MKNPTLVADFTQRLGTMSNSTVHEATCISAEYQSPLASCSTYGMR